MDWNDVFLKFLWVVVLPFSCISFCIASLTNDTRIFIAAEAIADQFYSLPYGWDAAYEVKPIGNRILNWCFYKIADAVIPFVSNNYFWFGVAVKACGLVILIICCWYISTNLLKGSRYAFPLIFLSFVCQANFGIMMAEWFAVLFSLVIVSLCLDEDKNWTVVAGAGVICVALLKGITSLLFLPIACAVILLGGKIDWRRAVVGVSLASILFLALCKMVWPYQILDTLLSSKIAHVGHYPINTLLSYFWITQTGMPLPPFLLTYIPIVIFGVISAVFLSIVYILRNDYRGLALLSVIWLVPIGIILIQSEFIGYHYLVLVFPSIISIVAMIKKKPKTHLAIPIFISFLVATFVIFNCFFGSYSEYEYSFWKIKEQNADIINLKYHLVDQSSILYLDPGDASYYFHANSSCRYITPMPVQRNDPPDWDITLWPQYAENRECILNYQGKYIVTDIENGSLYSYSIFKDSAISDMISRNYTKVDTRSWDVFEKRRGLG